MTKFLVLIAFAFGGFLTACGDSSDPLDSAAETVADKVDEVADDVAQTAEDAVADAVDDVADTVGEAVSEAGEDLGETVSDVADDVGQTAEDAVADAGEVIADAADDVAEAADDVADAVDGDDAVAVSLDEFNIHTENEFEAGTISFDVVNEGEFPHQFGIARGADYESLPLLANGAVDEEALGDDYLGATENIASGESATIDFDLEPGNYVFICNIAVGPNSHAKAGQVLSVLVN